MAIVGILGKDSDELADLFLHMCRQKGLFALASSYKLTDENAIPIVCIDENNSTPFFSQPQIWILQEAANLNPHLTITENCHVIINTDNPVSALPTCEGIITYGFNSKASVTASSISDDALQVCIQRSFKTLSDRIYEPQEFNTAFPQSANPLNVLGAITTCAVCDVLF